MDNSGLARHKDSVLLILALIFAVLVGYFDLHTDDMFVLVGFMAGSAFLLGLLQPRAAWRWGIVIGLAAPLAEAIAFIANIAAPYAPKSLQIPALLLIFLLTASISLVGAYAAVLLRRAMTASNSMPADRNS